MASQVHGEPNKANPPTDSQKKKKKKTQHRESEIKPTVPTITSLAEKTKPQYSLYRAKAIQTPILCLSKKKKKPLYQNQTKKTPILARRRRSSLLLLLLVARLPFVFIARPSSTQIALLRCLVLSACKSQIPPLRYFSLFFSLTLSQSFSLYLTESLK